VGQKVNPIGLRIGVIRDWESKWYAEKDYADLLHEDIKIREYIAKRLADASVSGVEIERAANRVNITIRTAKPGMVIGKGGSEVEALRKALNALTGKRVHINIVEVKKADIDAKLVAENIARQLENRVSFRRAQKAGDSTRHACRCKRNPDAGFRTFGRCGYCPCRTLQRRYSSASYASCGY